jgi:hypothetical protein
MLGIPSFLKEQACSPWRSGTLPRTNCWYWDVAEVAQFVVHVR